MHSLHYLVRGTVRLGEVGNAILSGLEGEGYTLLNGGISVRQFSVSTATGPSTWRKPNAGME